MSATGSVDRTRIRVVEVVVARANRWATDQLLEHALAVLRSEPDLTLRVSAVPGCFELAVACAAAARRADGVVALGAIIDDGTSHGHHLAGSVMGALVDLTVATGVPLGFGVLTVATDDEALDRIGTPGSRWDKGRDAAAALVTMMRRDDPPSPAGPGDRA